MIKGTKMSKASRERMSNAAIKKYQNGFVSPSKGKHLSKETIDKMRQTIKEKYKNGYTNPMMGKKRPDLSEYNHKCKSKELKEHNWLITKEVIEKRMKTA